MEVGLANLANGQPPFTFGTLPPCTLGSSAAIVMGKKKRGGRERQKERDFNRKALPGPHEGTGRIGFWRAGGFLSTPRKLL